jgi:hypothetical protein
MKAILNIALRSVRLEYKIAKDKLAPIDWQERDEIFKDWELLYKKNHIICKHTIFFDDTDEWQGVRLFDGRDIDFHYDYEERKKFDSKKDWANYMFQGYEYVHGEPQLYDYNEVDKVIVAY